MRFINTSQFSPVAQRYDMPWANDLFHKAPEEVPTNNRDYNDFITEENIIIDTEWWQKQYYRCMNGFAVSDSIEHGGDALIDDIDAFWNEGSKKNRIIEWMGEQKVIPPNSCYIPNYNLLIKDRKLQISNRMYWYLNFWKIYRLDYDRGVKDVFEPRFTDLDFLFYRRAELMVEQQKDGTEMKSRQQGAELPDSEPVLTDKGWKENGNLVVGDKVATHTGDYVNIIEVFPQGKKDVYRMTLIDGRTVRCGIDHKWLVSNSGWKGEKERVVTTKYLIESGLTKAANSGKNIEYKFKLPDIKPVPFTEEDLPINPYLIGLLLGDGTLDKSVRISTLDIEIIDNIKNILGENYKLHPEQGAYYNRERDTRWTISYKGKHTMEMKSRYGLKSIVNKFNPLLQELKLLGAVNICYNKSIPDIYKRASIEQRQELLRGLMDSDGSITNDGDMEFKSTSKQLAEDVAYVFRSLGAKVKINRFASNQGNHDYYRVYIKLVHFNPFKLKRKKKKFNPDKNIFKRVSIVSIEKLNYKEDSTCIMIDSKEQIYLTKDFIPTHNSEKMAGGIMGWNYHFVPSSTNIIAGGMSDDAQHTMDNFTRGARDLINTQFYKIRSKSSSDYYKSKYYGSEVMTISCKDNNQALARFSPFWVLLEEGGKWKKDLILDTKGFITPAIQAENRKTGYMHFVGTGGDMEQGAADMEELHYNPKRYNLVEYRNRWDKDNNEISVTGHFMTDVWFKVIDDEGNSLIKESNQAWESHYEHLKGKDKYNYTTQHARYASDAFLIQSGGYFGEEIANWCNERIGWIRTHRQAQTVERGFLNWNERGDWTKGVYWEPNVDGPFMIAEHPEYDKDNKPFLNLYKVGTDSYDQDEAFTSSSKGACWVKKGFLNADRTYNKYVAGLVERPTVAEGGREVFYEHTALLTMYYGGRNLIEHSNLLIFEWYERKGLNGLLKEKPEFVMSKMVNKTQTSNQYGIDPSTKPHWLRIQADWLRNKENIDKCDFIELLQAWAKFKYRPGVIRYNCDNTIASSLCSVLESDEEQYDVVSRGHERDRISTIPSFKTVNGELVMTLN